MSNIEIDIQAGRACWPVPPTTRIGGTVILMGYAVKESTGLAAAELDLFDGADATTGVSIPLPLQPGQAVIDWFGPEGVTFRNGLFPSLAAGAVSGAIFIVTPPHNYGRREGQ